MVNNNTSFWTRYTKELVRDVVTNNKLSSFWQTYYHRTQVGVGHDYQHQ